MAESRVNLWQELPDPYVGAAYLPVENDNDFRSLNVDKLSISVIPTTSTALQAVLDSVGASGGGIVKVAAGVVDVTEFINIPSNVTLKGSGRGVTILRGAGTVTSGNGFAVAIVGTLGATNGEIHSLTVDMQTNLIGTNGILFTGATSYTDFNTSVGCKAINCEVLTHDDQAGASGYAIWNRGAKNTRILFNDIKGDNLVFDSDSQVEGIEVFGGEDVLIFGNNIEDIGNAGIFITTAQGALAVPNRRISIIDNVVKSCNLGIANITTAVDTGGNSIITDGLRISGNKIFNPYGTGINVRQTIPAGSATDIAARNIQVDHNQVEIEAGIAGGADIVGGFFGSDGSLDGIWETVEVSYNIFNGGERVFGSNVQIRYLDNLSFNHNTIKNNDSIINGSSYALYCLNSDNVKFESNTFENIHSAAMLCQGTNAVVIQGNSFVNIGNNNGLHTVYLNNTIARPVIRNNTSQHQPNLRFITANTNVTDLYALSNTYVNTPTADQIAGMASANFGTVTIPDTQTSVSIPSALIEGEFAGRATVGQVSGTIEPFLVQQNSGSALVQRTGTSGASVYRYLIA